MPDSQPERDGGRRRIDPGALRNERVDRGPFRAYATLVNKPPRREDGAIQWLDVAQLIREGLPADAIDRLAARLDTPQKVILKVLGTSQRTYERRRRDGRPLDAAVADRAYRLVKLLAHAEDVFATPELAHDWLRTPNRMLGVAPIDILDTEAGADQVDQILGRVEHGVYG